jgi:hypothetical protein
VKAEPPKSQRLPRERLSGKLGLLLAVTVCLLFQLLQSSQFFDQFSSHFNSRELAWVVLICVETAWVFGILYLTPFFQGTSGAVRAGILAGIAHCMVIGTGIAYSVFWAVVCFAVGVSPRDI